MKLLRLKTGFRVFLSAIVLLLFLGAGYQETDLEIPDISKRINEFTIDLLKHNARAKDMPLNMILSPQSIFYGLAMSYVASEGETREELAQAFRFPDDNKQVLKDLADLHKQLLNTARDNLIILSIANSAWLDDTNVDFREEYVKEVEGAFDASLHRVKFAQREQACKDINMWISEMTHGKIQKGVRPEDFDSRSWSVGVIEKIDESALVSVNIAYFKAYWGSQFDEASTRKRPFHIDAINETETMMMHQRSLLPYSENDKIKFLKIPYIDGGYSMYVLLPKEIMTIQELMDTVTDDMILALRNTFMYNLREVDVLLPKFEIKNHLSVKDTLSEMGVKSAFDRKQADFDKMIDKKSKRVRIYISEIYHDAWIDVHEEGTEATAATTSVHRSCCIGCSASPHQHKPAEFHADHPFLFMIIHNQSQSILFAGWISNPEKIAQ